MRDRVQHQPEEPARLGERAQLSSSRLRGVSKTPRQPPWEQSTGAPAARSRISRRRPSTRALDRGSRRARRGGRRAPDRAATGCHPPRPRRPRTGCAGSRSGRPSARRVRGRRPPATSRPRSTRPPRARASARCAHPTRQRRDPRGRDLHDARGVLADGVLECGDEQRLRSEPSGCTTMSTYTGHTCRPTPPRSGSGNHVSANTFVSPRRRSRYASSIRRSTCASAITARP